MAEGTRKRLLEAAVADAGRHNRAKCDGQAMVGFGYNREMIVADQVGLESTEAEDVMAVDAVVGAASLELILLLLLLLLLVRVRVLTPHYH